MEARVKSGASTLKLKDIGGEMPGSALSSPSTEAETEPAGTTALTLTTEEAGTSTILTQGTGAGRCLLFFDFFTRATGTGTDKETGESECPDWPINREWLE